MGVFSENTIIGASAQESGYEIEQSLRFNDDDSAYLSRTPSSTGNRKTWTWSGWVKRGNLTGTRQAIFVANLTNSIQWGLEFDASNKLNVYDSFGLTQATTAAVYRDTSAWYHIVVVSDTTNATAADRFKLYVNGERITSWTTAPSTITQNTDTIVNYTCAHNLGSWEPTDSLLELDGYLAEVHFIDGTALDASSFGETNSDTNQWVPIEYVGTYGTNGFYLNFSNSASLGTDSSGNGNNLTVTNLAATDQMLDSPTNNFCTWNPLMKGGRTSLSEGNLKVNNTSAVQNNYNGTIGTQLITSGKWYWEHVFTDDRNGMIIGVFRAPSNNFNNWLVDADGGVIWNGDGAFIYSTNGIVYYDSSTYSSIAVADNDILQIAFDADNGDLYMGVNGTWANSGSPVMTGIGLHGASGWVPGVRCNAETGTFYSYVNFGQDSSFAGIKTAQGNTDGNGKGDFHYSPLSGYLALCEDNLPDPSISLPGEHFNTVLYSGNSSTQAITGVGFQPDWSWTKVRNAVDSHVLVDVVRGDKALRTNSTIAEYTTGVSWQFDSDGFTMTGTTGELNYSSYNYAVWNWKADNTSGSTNTDGTITSTVSANPTAGFSIVSFTGTGSGSATIGHGLSSAPEFITVKRRATTSNWDSYIGPVGNNGGMSLNGTNAFAVSSAYFNNTSPTASVFTIGSGLNAAVTCIAYCFHSVEGYSKIGSYEGNGSSTNNTFVYTGFRPAFIMQKNADAGSSWWLIHDNKRTPYNQAGTALGAQAANGDTAGFNLDILSNGFKIRDAEPSIGNSNTYIYVAFAESPFKYSNAR